MYIDDAPSDSKKKSVKSLGIASFVNNIMGLPEDEYKDVWEIPSLHPIVTIKGATDDALGKRDYTSSILISFFITLLTQDFNSGTERNVNMKVTSTVMETDICFEDLYSNIELTRLVKIPLVQILKWNKALSNCHFHLNQQM